MKEAAACHANGSALLDAIVGALPVGVSAQNETGRLLVLNEPAALAIGDEISRLRGKIPFGVRGASAFCSISAAATHGCASASS